MGDSEGGSILEGVDLKHLNREEAEKIVAQGPEAIVAALLQLSALARGKEMPAPTTLISQIPPYL